MLDHIKRKTRRKSICGDAESTTSGSLANSAHQLEIQNSRIESLEARLTSLGAAHQDGLSSLRTLERSQSEVISQMVIFQHSTTRQDGLLRGLVQYLWRDSGAGECLFYLAHCDAHLIMFRAILNNKVKRINSQPTII
jgi:hypothetical protein